MNNLLVYQSLIRVDNLSRTSELIDWFIAQLIIDYLLNVRHTLAYSPLALFFNLRATFVCLILSCFI